jgi:mannose-6-phosphate isomerase-like protein (cupin superfamily)
MYKQINFRPWGWWMNLHEEPGYLVKVININKGHQLSLQKHKHREESWTIARGKGEIFCENFWQVARQGKMVKIKEGTPHRAKATDDNLVIIEVQHGEILSEDDIYRIEDDYGRVVETQNE